MPGRALAGAVDAVCSRASCSAAVSATQGLAFFSIASMSKAPSALRNDFWFCADSTASSVSRNGATFASVDPGTMASDSAVSVLS